MTSADIQRQLDNPFWASLATRHAHIALGGPLARRYPVDVSPIAGLPGAESANITALEALVEIGDDMGYAGPFTLKLPGNWETVHASLLTQMIRADRTPLPEGEFNATILGPADVPEMLALVELTHPGPFRPRTIELGTYIGIREDGRLVAMAGERLWVRDCREVSAVCTHPDVEGRGYARALSSRVVNRMLRAGETPFLHVESSKARALGVYRSLGFERRAEYPLVHARRIG
ncbi:MAG: GNAT family N-acetyltransferase [Betaproteobacteria bacterium]